MLSPPLRGEPCAFSTSGTDLTRHDTSLISTEVSRTTIFPFVVLWLTSAQIFSLEAFLDCVDFVSVPLTFGICVEVAFTLDAGVAFSLLDGCSFSAEVVSWISSLVALVFLGDRSYFLDFLPPLLGLRFGLLSFSGFTGGIFLSFEVVKLLFLVDCSVNSFERCTLFSFTYCPFASRAGF